MPKKQRKVKKTTLLMAGESIGQPTSKYSYSPLFDKPVLEQTRVRTVKRLIGFILGES